MASAAEDIAAQLDIVGARERAKTDPVWFAENILQLRQLSGEPGLEDPDRSWVMDTWTVQLLDSAGDIVRKQKGMPTVINHDGLKNITVRSMHGPGKTFSIAILMHWFGFCFPSKIPCVAPKEGHLKTRLWPEFQKILLRAMPHYRALVDYGAKTIWWGKKSWAFMETASTPEAGAGLHYDYQMILVDEASGVDEKFWPVLDSSMTTGRILIRVIISNPTKLLGTFADTHLKESVMKNWFQMHIRLEDTKRVKRDWVQSMIDKYGDDSPVVKIRCYGEFASEDVNQLLSVDWIQEARERSTKPDGSIPRQRISVDVSDGGQDFTVITHGIHYESFLHLKEQQEKSYPSGQSHLMTAKAVTDMWKANGLDADNGDDIVVDSVGVGSGVYSILINAGYPVVKYMGGAASDNPKLYRVRRVQSYLVFRDWLRDGQIAIDEDFVRENQEWDDLLGQLCSVRRNPNTDRIEDLMTKTEMIAKGIKSPDRADSIAMQFATQSPEVPIGESEFIVIPGMSEGYDAGLT